MALQIKTNLLLDILNPLEKTNKYSKGLLNLRTTLELEKDEGFNIPKPILVRIDKLELKAKEFLNKIPLKIIEKAYYKNSASFKKEIFVNFENNSGTFHINRLYMELEEFYNELFIVASLLANYYNLEIKIKTKNNNDYA